MIRKRNMFTQKSPKVKPTAAFTVEALVTPNGPEMNHENMSF
jgi:hypothetical protein